MTRTETEAKVRSMGSRYEKALITTAEDFSVQCGMSENEAYRELDDMVKRGSAERVGHVQVNGRGLNMMATVAPLFAVFCPED